MGRHKDYVGTVQLRVAVPDRLLREQQAEFVVIPAQDGDIGVAASHAPFLSPLREGTVIIRTGDKEDEMLPVSGGFVEVVDNRVTLVLPGDGD